MKWLGKLFGVAGDEREPICLQDICPFWEADGPKGWVDLFNALLEWLPEGSILYFEDGAPDKEIREFFRKYSFPGTARIRLGTVTLWPKFYHVPANKTTLRELAEMMSHRAGPELAIHFHVYREKIVLLEWHDAFIDPLLISGTLSEEKVKDLADKFGTEFWVAGSR